MYMYMYIVSIYIYMYMYMIGKGISNNVRTCTCICFVTYIYMYVHVHVIQYVHEQVHVAFYVLESGQLWFHLITVTCIFPPLLFHVLLSPSCQGWDERVYFQQRPVKENMEWVVQGTGSNVLCTCTYVHAHVHYVHYVTLIVACLCYSWPHRLLIRQMSSYRSVVHVQKMGG